MIELPGKKFNVMIRTYLAVSLQSERHIWTCKNKHTWAYDYKKVFYFMGQSSWHSYLGHRYDPPRFDLYRVSDGEEKSIHHATCPTCEKQGKEKVVKGTKTEKICDQRCRSAKGADCECSCGGAHHGEDYVVL